MDAVDSKVIKVIGAELQDVPVSDARAAELATEVGRLNAAVLRERRALRFEDEPAHFAAFSTVSPYERSCAARFV